MSTIREGPRKARSSSRRPHRSTPYVLSTSCQLSLHTPMHACILMHNPVVSLSTPRLALPANPSLNSSQSTSSRLRSRPLPARKVKRPSSRCESRVAFTERGGGTPRRGKRKRRGTKSASQGHPLTSHQPLRLHDVSHVSSKPSNHLSDHNVIPAPRLIHDLASRKIQPPPETTTTATTTTTTTTQASQALPL